MTVMHLVIIYLIRLGMFLYVSLPKSATMRASTIRPHVIFQRVDAIEEAFSCFLVYKPEAQSEKLLTFQQELSSVMATLGPEPLENCIRVYLNSAATIPNNCKMKTMLKVLENLVNSNVLQARYVSLIGFPDIDKI